MNTDYNESVQDMLRDHLVYIVNHQAIQCKMLADRDVTCDRAHHLAKSLETAEKGSHHNITGRQTFTCS